MPLYPYHRQDFPDWCGAACIQMVLEKNNLLAAHAGQRSIFEAVRDVAANWNASPDKVAAWLKLYLPAAAPPAGDYGLFWKPDNHSVGATEAEALEVLAAVKASAAEGVLIPSRQYNHWVVVTDAFTDDWEYSRLGQLYLVVNDPLAPGGKEVAHGNGPCPSGKCGPSPEIWGPVAVSDFLRQRSLGSLCIRRAAEAPALPPVEISDALAGPGAESAHTRDEIVKAALAHYGNFVSRLGGELPLAVSQGVGIRSPSFPSLLPVSSPSDSNYPKRVQVRLDDIKDLLTPRFSVFVEMCAWSFRLSRVRYVDNKPDWWGAGYQWTSGHTC